MPELLIHAHSYLSFRPSEAKEKLAVSFECQPIAYSGKARPFVSGANQINTIRQGRSNLSPPQA